MVWSFVSPQFLYVFIGLQNLLFLACDRNLQLVMLDRSQWQNNTILTKYFTTYWQPPWQINLLHSILFWYIYTKYLNSFDFLQAPYIQWLLKNYSSWDFGVVVFFFLNLYSHPRCGIKCTQQAVFLRHHFAEVFVSLSNIFTMWDSAWRLSWEQGVQEKGPLAICCF